jgi:N-acetylneuraminic acid mutarotase
MTNARARHGAVLLLNGRVLVSGGDNLGATSSAEIYDPSANTWSPAADVPTISDGAAITLPDGKVLHYLHAYDPGANTWTATSGFVNLNAPSYTQLGDGRVVAAYGGALVAPPSPYSNRAYVFNPPSNTWTEVTAAANERTGPTATTLGNGNLLYTGGIMQIAGTPTGVNVAETYDPSTDTWQSVDSMTSVRVDHTATLLPDGRALVIGGHNGIAVTGTAEIYDATRWRPAASMSIGRRAPGVALLHDGRVVVAGTAGAETYDPLTNAWTSTGPMIVGNRRNVALVTLRTGKVIAIGGLLGSLTSFLPATDATEIYDPATNAWTAGPTLPMAGVASAARLPDGRVVALVTPYPYPDSFATIYDPVANVWSPAVFHPANSQAGAAMTLLQDGSMMISGGYYYISGIAIAAGNDARRFSPVTNTWIDLPPMSAARMNHIATTLPDGRVLVAGESAEIYDPAFNTWAAVAPMSTGRTFATASLLYDGRALVSGGTSPEIVLDSAELYSPSGGAWSSAGSMTQGRYWHSSIRLTNGNVLALGGHPAGASTTETPSAEVYDLGNLYDTDGDGYSDGLELALGQHPWSNCAIMRADVNGDGKVNSGDQLKVTLEFGVKPPRARLDQNGDKNINSGDQLKVVLNFGKSVLSCP